MHRWTKIKHFYLRHSLISCLGVFILAAGLFLYLQATPFLADPDSFYHAKMALLLRDRGIISDFPWLAQFTILGSSYINQHLLYHALLIPFVTWLDPLIGIKVSTVLLASGVVAVFCFVLKKLGVRGAALYALVLLATNPFTFRMSLAKAPSLSLIFLLLGIYLLWTERYYVLAALSFLYVWTYGGFSLLLVLTVVHVLVLFVWRLITTRHHTWQLRWPAIRRSEAFKALLAVGGGMLLGLIVNPYFPTNIFFYKAQLFDIGIVNYRDVIGVGGEWYPYGITDLIPGTFLVSILVLITTLLFIIFYRRQTPYSISSLLYFLFFLLLTLKSRRYVEYYVPMAMLYVAITLYTSLHGHDWRVFFRRVKIFFFQHQVISMLLLVYVLVMLPAILIKDLQVARRDLESGIALTAFAPAMNWLRENSAPGDTVFHSDWDEFPILFYQNDHNYYIVGLDPTFMYKFDPELHKLWADITKGEHKNDLYEIIQGRFAARFVFLEKDHKKMDANIASDSRFKLVYQDAESKIYALEP